MTSEGPSAKVRKNITVPEELYVEFVSLGGDGESQPEILSRLLRIQNEVGELNVTDIEWLQNEADVGESPAAALSRLREEIISLRARCVGYEEEVLAVRAVNDVLQDGIDKFGKLGSRTALAAPGQTVIGDFGGDAIKDTMETVKDVCDDETVCGKTALHLIDTQADVMGKQLDRDHASDEKQLDRDHARDEKEKDRKLKQDLETSKIDHQKNLALIKKGIVRDGDLEGVTFLGSMEKRKTPGERLADMKNRAYHAANGEEGDFCDPDDGDAGESEEGLDEQPPE